MAREVTQRQWAEQLYGSLTCTTYREGYQDPDNDIDIIEQALSAARQEALREAVSKIRSRGDEYMRDCKAKDASGKKYRDTYEMRRVNSGRAWAFKDLADELDRLAREGVKG